ncbi:hypothetical protein CBM2586_A50440 [Cupriavidus phytorum]|uniref:Uncharacterized protein n=1 Tax=Cupriavidus taiwanensis TaxID=164546 RepID=A0A375C427_9BURK|nr:hypothetical protein CBM2586_A50440 [Cupriavidus taiwanensis]
MQLYCKRAEILGVTNYFGANFIWVGEGKPEVAIRADGSFHQLSSFLRNLQLLFGNDSVIK